MSYKNFEKAIELAIQCKDYRIGGEKPDSLINNAEKILGMKFSKQTYLYFKRLGCLSFRGCEVFGIIDDNFSGILEGNSINYALFEREKYQLPQEWLPIYNFDDGFMGFLDYNELNEDCEPPVIMAIYNGSEYVVTEKISEDFGDFLLMLVKEEIDD